MDGNIKLSATVISCKGQDCDKDDFYFDGNFSSCHSTQSIQLSFEKSSDNFVFAVSDSMGSENEEPSNISAVREVKRYHESAKRQQFSLENVTQNVYDTIQLLSNLLYSKSISNTENSFKLTGFSSLIIDNNRATIMNLGSNGAFLYRQGEQKDIFNKIDSKKNEKLKMLGIAPNSPDMFSDTGRILKIAEEESKTKIKLSPTIELEQDDIILLCSDGILDIIGKMRMEAVVNSGFDPSKIASILFQESAKNGTSQGITVMVIRVDEIRNIPNSTGRKRLNEVEYNNDYEDEESDSDRGKSIVNYILGLVCVLVISGVLFMGYLIVKNSGIFTSGNANKDASQTSSAVASQSAASDSLIDTAGADSAAEEAQSDDNSQTKDDSQTDSKPADSDSQKASVNKVQTKKPVTDQTKDQDSQLTKDQTEKDVKPDETKDISGEYDTYIVQSGDTLSSISSKYYGDLTQYKKIMEYNKLKSENVYVGQELKIPKK